MSDTKQANAMVRMAHRDRTALHGMRDTSVFADEIFGFHAQQAIEKGLKAWMCAMGIAYPHSHHINRLLVLLSDAGADVAAFWGTDEFTIYAHQARYEEGHLELDAPLNRDAVLATVDALIAQVEAAICALR